MFTVKKNYAQKCASKKLKSTCLQTKNFQFLLFVSMIETDTTLNKDTIKDIHFKMPWDRFFQVMEVTKKSLFGIGEVKCGGLI